jgi:hypothetical protein
MGKYKIKTVFESIDKMTAPVRKMAGAVNRFTISAENGLRKVDNAFNGISSTITSGTMNIAKWGAGMAAAGVLAAGVLNQQQQEVENLTNAVGANIQTVEAVSSALANTGLSVDNVIDLYEEMNNKLGESKGLEEITAVSESLAILGLRFTDIKHLKPEEQFKKITNAALKMEDATKAQAAADILMGGEANKVLGVLRQQGKSMEDIIGNYQMLSFRTERSRQGARDMAREQTKSIQLFQSMSKEISGLVGVHLVPLIDKFNKFLIANKEVIGQSIDKFFGEIAASVGDVSTLFDRALNGLKSLHANFESVKDWAVTIAKVTAGVAALMAGLNIFIGVMTAVNLVMAMNPAVWVVAGIAAAVTALAAAAYTIYDNWDGIKSYFAGLYDYFADLFGGIAGLYESTIGSVVNDLKNVKNFVFGSDDEESDINVTRNVANDVVMSPQQRQAMYYGNMQGSVDVNVYGHNGVKPERETYTSRLQLATSGR